MPSHPVILRPSPSVIPPLKDRCRIHDGDVTACDATSGCAYYYCSQSCWLRGTPNSTACSGTRSSSTRQFSSGYPFDYPNFFWGAVAGGALVFAGLVGVMLTKFLLSPRSKNGQGVGVMDFAEWWVKGTTRAIQGETTPRYDAVLAGVMIFAFLFSLVDLIDLLLAFLLGKPIDLPSQAGFISFRLPIVMAAPLLFIRFWKLHVRPAFVEGRKPTASVARALRAYLVVTIAVTTSLLVLFAAKLFYLFLLWGFSAPNFDPLQTSRPFSYLFVTLPIAGIHYALFRRLKKNLSRGTTRT